MQHRCPRATRVVVSGRAPRFADSLPDLLRKIAVMCPAGMIVSASILSGDGSYDCCVKRSLWQRVGEDTNGGQWAKTCPDWVRKSVLLPPKAFRGPVGAFQRAWHKFDGFCLQDTATRVLLLEAIERQHFQKQNKPFGCFKCDAQLKSLGDWTQHAIKTQHDDGVAPPDNFIPSFDLYNKKMERLDQERREAWDQVYEDWGEDGSEKRQNAKQVFLYQLDNDPLYAQAEPAEESLMWKAFQIHMDPNGC